MKTLIVPIQYLLLLLTLVITQTTYAKDITYTGPIVNKVDIIANSTTINLVDPNYGDLGEGTSYVRNYTAVPALIYNRDLKSDLAGNVWSYQVEYDILYSTRTQSIAKSGVLFIEHNNTEGIYEAIGIHEEVVGNIRLRVRNVTTTGNVPNDIHLQLQLKVERYNFLDDADPITKNETSLTTASNVTDNQLEVSWELVDGAEYYELEWVYWDATYNLQNSNLTSMDLGTFFEKAVRIETSENYYKFDLFYPQGAVYIRVRPVGRYIQNMNGDYGHLKYGTWVEGTNPDLNAFSVVLTTGFENERIWQVQRNFAEEAKSKQVIQYFDDGMRGRQTLTNLSSDDLTIVAENVYDAEGRASLSILPVPIKSLIGKNPLQFGASTTTAGEGGLVSTGAINYNYNDFDKTDFANPLTKVDATGKEHVSNVYYSSENPFNNQIHRDYIPDAEGYPITQVKFLNDATGRIARQSGVGDFYQLGTNHETKYYYSNLTHAELRRLFGKNVGDEMHYRKNYVVDANGQISVSYIDQAGQTIATALAGKSPENVNVLDSEGDGTSTITSNLMGKNVIDDTENTSILSHSIFCDEAPRTDQFTYNLKGGSINLPDPTNSICIGCQYQVNISLIDEEGNTVPLVLPTPSGGGPAPIYNGISTQLVDGEIVVNYNSLYDNTCAPIPSVNIEFEATLQNVGSYMLRKTLKVIKPDPNRLLAQLQNSGALENKQDFVTNYVLSNLDPTECEYCNAEIRLSLCEEIAAAEYPTYAAAQSGTTDYQIYTDRVQYYLSNTNTYPDCDDLRGILAMETGLINECAAKLELMKQQMTPTGDPMDQNQGCIYQNTGFWKYVYNQNSSIQLERYGINGVATTIRTFNNENDFVAFIQNPSNWQDHFIDAFIQYHPEYCLYEACMSDEMLESRRFDFELADLTSWDDATDFAANLQASVSITTPLSFVSVQEIINIDPFNSLNNNFSNEMSTALSTYCTDVYNNTANNPSGVSCSCGNVLCYIEDILNNPATYAGSTSLAPMSDEEKWTIFRGIYAKEKARLQQNYLETLYSCIDAGVTSSLRCSRIMNADPTQAWADGHNADPANLLDLQAIAGTTTTNNCDAICEGNARNWVAQLCPDLEENNSIGYVKLINDFTKFCKGHCGATSDNPMGYLLEEYFDPSSPNYALDPALSTYNQDLANAQGRLDFFMNNAPFYCGYDLVNNPLPDATVVFNRTDVYEWTSLYHLGSNGLEPECINDLTCAFDILKQSNIFPTKYTNSSASCPVSNDFDLFAGSVAYSFTYSLPSNSCNDYNYVDLGFYEDPNLYIRYLCEEARHDYFIKFNTPFSSTHANIVFSLKDKSTGVSINPLTIQSIVNYDNVTNTVTLTLKESCIWNLPSYLVNNTTNQSINCNDMFASCTGGVKQVVATIDIIKGFNNNSRAVYLSQNCNRCQGYWAPKKNQLSINLDSVKAQCIEQQIAELVRNAEDAYDVYLADKLEQLISEEPCMAFTESMKTKYTTTEHHYTLYYYDQAGNLIQTIPPIAVEPLPISNFSTTTGTWDGTDPSHDYEMVTTYQYNTLGQVIRQESPDGGLTEFWYDYAQRLRFSRNARQAVVGQYAYTKFDAQGRTIEIGRLDGHGAISDWELNKTTFPESTSSLQERIVTEYEEASFSPIVQGNLRGRVARTYNDHIATYYDYDVHGNVKKIQHQIAGFGASEIEYDYDLITGNVKEVAFMRGTEDQFFHRYFYDADNRLTQAMTSTNECIWDVDARYFYYAHGPLARIELGEDKVQGLDYFYNLQGWIKGVNNTNSESDMGLDGLINNDPLNGGTSISSRNKWFGQDEAAYYLGYHREDYKAIGTSRNLGAFEHSATIPFNDDIKGLGSVQGLYNGNIAFMISHIPKLKEANTSTQKTQAMVYQYDALHRITKSESYAYQSGNGWNKAGLNNAYRTAYSYDANGNIMSLDRYTLNNDNVNPPTSKLIDNLTYQYGSNKLKNSLVSISDGAGITTGINDVGSTPLYTYDKIGNLLTDGTNTIEWNLQNKVASVDNNNFDIFYTYDVNGNRLTKVLDSKTTGVPTQTTFYIRDASGNIMGTYLVEDDGGTYSEKLEEIPIYGSSRLGIQQYSVALSPFIPPTITDPKLMNSSLVGILGLDRAGKSTRGEKVFEISNHLGNVLATVSDQKLGYLTALGQTAAQGYKAQVQSAQDYYAFGWEMPGRKFNTGDYRHGFNGKENDREWGDQLIQDYGFRLYNPAIGKFLSVDPLAPDYPELTPYQFASNTPLWAIDLDGLEAYFIHGTNAGPERWTNIWLDEVRPQGENNNFLTESLLQLTNSESIDDGFAWNFIVPGRIGGNFWKRNLNGTHNSVADRTLAANVLVEYIVEQHTTIESNGSTTVNWDEPITLIGHSHGGNVAIQAAKQLFLEHGITVDIITIGTPTMADGQGGLEDPNGGLGAEGIIHHLHIWNRIDGIQGGATGGDLDERYNLVGDNTPGGKTQSIEIDASTIYNFNERVDAHSMDARAPGEFVRQLNANQDSNFLIRNE